MLGIVQKTYQITKNWQIPFRCLLLLVLSLSAFSSHSQVTATIDSTTLKIGSQINYSIKVEADSSDLVVFPEGQTFFPLEAVEASEIDTLTKDQAYQFNRVYKLTQFDSGAYTIPPQKILINDKTYFTDSINVAFKAVKVDTTKQKLYDIKPIITVEKPQSYWWLYLIGILLLLSGIGGLIYWLVWRKKPLTEAEEIALLPPYERAKMALETLNASNYLERGDIKSFYSELTMALRKYLDEKVYDRAMESTTDELISRLILLKEGNQIPLKKESVENISSILRRADLVKFAKSKPDIELAKMDESTISKEIDEVKLALPEPSEEEKLLDQAYKEAQERKEKRRKILITSVIALFLVVATFVGFSMTYGFNYVKDTIIGHESKELLEGEWVKSAYGFPPIYIETPKVLKRMDAPLPEEAKDKVELTVFGYGSLIEQLNIVTSTTVLKGQPSQKESDEQKMINLNQVIEGNLNTWEDKGVRNIITKNEKFTTPNGAEGVKTFGTAQFPDVTGTNYENGEYLFLSFTTEQVIQQVVITWKSNDDYAPSIVDRIVNSVELNPEKQEQEAEE